MSAIPKFAFAAACLILALPAWAADKLAQGPIPAWVKPLEIKPPPLGDAGLPVRVLLQDRQLHFGPGGDAEFTEQVAQIRTPEGLTPLGTVQLAWNPDTDTVTVHRLRILRDRQVIDVLAKQQFTIIRREANLERAVVDGLLTATLQPEGLQVGDVVDFAYSVVHADPVLKGHADRSALFPPVGRVDRLRIRASWDAKRPVRWRMGYGLDKPRVDRRGGQTELVVDMTSPAELKVTTGAPLRYYPLRELQFSEFQSWAEVSALMEPHFTAAAKLSPDSPLHAEVARIRAASSDPKARAGAALALVEDKIRYLAIVMNLGGYVPQSADRTWALRYGDCKAKTVLLMALLRELGIEAEPAVVSAMRGDGVNERLPAVRAFDHVIVRATIGGQVYWLDGTRTGESNIDAVRPPPFLWALPLRPAGADLIPIVQPVPSSPDSAIRLVVDASAGLDAPAKVQGEMILAAQIRPASSQLADERETALKRVWTATYPWIEVRTVTATPDPATGSTRIVMEGTGKPPFERAPAGRSFRIRSAEVSGGRSYERDADQPNRDAPFLVEGFPSYTAFSLKITLPNGGRGFAFDAPDLDTVVAGRAFTRRARIEKGVATLEATRRTLVREISAADAAKAKAVMDDLAKVRVALRAPIRYQPTEADLAALKASTPTTAQGFIERGDNLIQRGLVDEAMADFNKAVELDPKSAFAYANRALGHLYGGRPDAAKADIAKAQEIDPRNFVALHAAGQVAMREGRYADAAAAFGRAADLRADNTFALRAQAGAYAAMNEVDKALASLAELERIAPQTPDLPVLRYTVYASASLRDEALREIDKAIAKAPDEAQLHLYRANLLDQAGRRAEAETAYARAIEIQPSPEAYMARAARRDAAQVAARLADLDAAEKLLPKAPRIAAQRAGVLADAGRYPEALAVLQPALKAKADDADLLLARADVYLRSGQAGPAARDFAALRAKAGAQPDQLNALCWQQAIRNHALEQALADCDAALKAAPAHANALDSRAFVLMRLGRLPEALAAYDAAIRARPRQAESLFGRALTRARMDQPVEAEADIKAARSADAGIDKTFADYGLVPPTALAAKPTTTASVEDVVGQNKP